MAPKYTILKVLIHNSSKGHNSKQGFTLLELIAGLVMMVIVSSLALNAFVNASTSFNKDKRNIESNQNLTAVLEIIGNDIRQSGEQINDPQFPVIKIEPAATGDMSGSSKITIRRALTSPLTLCEDIAPTFAATKITVTDDTKTSFANCLPGTPVTVGAIVRPAPLKEARDKRCQLDDPNGDYSSPTTTDFCLTTKPTLPDPDLEQVLAAVSDQAGNMRTFKYVDDGGTTTPSKYQIDITGLSPDPTTTYITGKPIYLIEERVYTLASDGSFKLNIDNKGAATLIKGIAQFKVSARVYGDKTTKNPDAIDPASTIVGTTNVLPLSRRCVSTIPYYICQFNNATVDDWKTLQGVKVELDAKYDSTGRASESSTNPGDIAQVAKDKEKLKAIAEYFPRNVLSK
ncbi:type II secretion system protein [Chamaesiphon sp. OTE_8_metabat_110]|uniref:PilW family protein n=1 Tax=Chamaesiphon sp. OTE_8_metabat_110 TaxID=2964696 RepID=UPI00286AF2E4|nr:type II secretion system protein [Chamaesiphon sp. OTE_8_metabat_110]